MLNEIHFVAVFSVHCSLPIICLVFLFSHFISISWKTARRRRQPIYRKQNPPCDMPISHAHECECCEHVWNRFHRMRIHAHWIHFNLYLDHIYISIPKRRKKRNGTISIYLKSMIITIFICHTHTFTHKARTMPNGRKENTIRTEIKIEETVENCADKRRRKMYANEGTGEETEEIIIIMTFVGTKLFIQQKQMMIIIAIMTINVNNMQIRCDPACFLTLPFCRKSSILFGELLSIPRQRQCRHRK